MGVKLDGPAFRWGGDMGSCNGGLSLLEPAGPGGDRRRAGLGRRRSEVKPGAGVGMGAAEAAALGFTLCALSALVQKSSRHRILVSRSTRAP